VSQSGEIKATCPTVAQWPDVARQIYDGFGDASEFDQDALNEQARRPERRIAVRSDKQCIGGCFSYQMRLAVPSHSDKPNQSIAVAGLAGVAVSPAAQGRGALTAMMRYHLRQVKNLGDAASVLMASESGLYGRYGYAVATEMAQWHINIREFSLQCELDGSIVLLHDRSEMHRRLASLHQTHCTLQAGELLRDPLWWQLTLDPPKSSWTAYGTAM